MYQQTLRRPFFVTDDVGEGDVCGEWSKGVGGRKMFRPYIYTIVFTVEALRDANYLKQEKDKCPYIQIIPLIVEANKQTNNVNKKHNGIDVCAKHFSPAHP
ncbi:MAG: hypothetical protein LBJ39_01310 [Tannerellaceae bacterium]|jgi:hypothetical protein|nr:hypothetical protein [Tannerellaceae bacterium]